MAGTLAPFHTLTEFHDPFILLFNATRVIPAGALRRVLAYLSRVATPRDLALVVFCSAGSSFAGTAVSATFVCRQARRNQVLASMGGRSEQARKGWVVDKLGAFVLAISAARRGWKTATSNVVFDYLFFLDTQGNTLRWCINNLASAGAGGYGFSHGRTLTTPPVYNGVALSLSSQRVNI